MDRLLHEMQKLIGRHIRYEGCHCEIIEILAEGPAVVLHKYTTSEIQPNLFGEAQRRAPGTYTLPLYSRETHDIHPVILAALEPGETQALRRLGKAVSPDLS